MDVTIISRHIIMMIGCERSTFCYGNDPLVESTTLSVMIISTTIVAIGAALTNPTSKTLNLQAQSATGMSLYYFLKFLSFCVIGTLHDFKVGGGVYQTQGVLLPYFFSLDYAIQLEPTYLRAYICLYWLFCVMYVIERKIRELGAVKIACKNCFEYLK